jgi:putative hydrolase of the HAD superfamily
MGNWAVFPDVPDALRRLRASGLRVGVLSNAGSQLPAFLASLGLADLLDFAVVSAVEGVRKPDRRIFERALELAGARPEEALHVGDMYVEDVLGARRVGVRPILMDRGSRRMFPNHSEQGDFEVATSLAEIVAELGIGSNGGR